MAKVIRDGKTFEIDDSDDSLAAARAKGYAPIITVTKNGSDTFDLNSDDTESVKAAFKKGYSDVNTFKNLPKHEGPGRLESLAQGVASSATLGHDDELSAGVGKLLGRDYDEELKRVRGLKHEREDAHPAYNFGGNVIGAIASPLNKIPGANSIGGLVAQGAVQGEGDSQAKDLAGVAEDAAKGGAMAGAFGAAMKGAGKLASKLPSSVTGISDDTAKYYMANHGAVDAARPIKDITDDFMGSVGTYKRQLSNESTEGFNALKASGRSASADELAGIVGQQSERQGVNAITGKAKSLASELETLKGEIADSADETGRIPYDKIKSYIKQIDDEIDHEAVRYGHASSRDRSLMQIRQGLDKEIKKDDEYARIMKSLASKSSALEDMGNGLRNDKSADKMLARISKGKDPRAAEALTGLDEKMGTSYGKDLQDSSTKDLFTKENSRGSRNTIVAGGLATLLGGVVGIPPWIAAPIGAAAGPVVDKHGREIYRKMLKAAAENPEAIAKFQKALDSAAQSGPASLVATHRLLMNKHPEYKKAMGDE